MRAVASLAVAALATIAVPASAEDDRQAWAAVTASGAVRGDLFLWLEGQARATDEVGGGSQIILRPAIGARIGRDAHAVAGYAFVRTDPAGGSATDEHRPWQQVQFVPVRLASGAPLVISRTRLEQRMVEGREGTGWRLRQFAETKAVQLAEAAKIGFDVPRTVMTNDPGINPPVADSQSVAIKSVDTLLLRDGPDQLFGYTSIMDWRHAAVPELMAAPLTVQQALVNKLDLRITVVEDRLWCTSIRRGGAGIEGDWRLTGKDQLEIVDHVLGDEDANRCRELVTRLGLRYGAIDLAVAAGRTWFIEINPTGEWGWLDGETRPIAAAIADSLSCPR